MLQHQGIPATLPYRTGMLPTGISGNGSTLYENPIMKAMIMGSAYTYTSLSAKICAHIVAVPQELPRTTKLKAHI